MSRAENLALARSLAANWGRWCEWRGEMGSPLGRPPRTACGTLERRYRAPSQWHPPNPRPAEPADPAGYQVHMAYTRLPELSRRVLVVEFIRRPHFLRPGGYDGMLMAAIVARVSPRLYPQTLDKALLSLFNVLAERKAIDRGNVAAHIDAQAPEVRPHEPA